MGQQQILMIVLGLIIVGIAIAVGIAQFGSDSISSAKDGLINDLNNHSINAFQYKSLPRSMGGGSGSYVGYRIPTKLQSNEDGTFSVSATTMSRVTFVATSVIGYGTITVICDSLGQLGAFTYAGQFQSQ